MLLAIKTVDRDEDPAKRIKIDSKRLLRRDLHHFTMKDAMLFFEMLNLKTDFLELPIDQWHIDASFRESPAIVQALSVVNNYDDRGVSLVEEYSGRITKDEEQLQFLFQLVADHKKNFPNALKQTLMDELSQ